MLLCIIVFVIINIAFLCLCKKVEKSMYCYNTAFCKDVRASLGMFVYRSELENIRKKLGKSKF